MKIGQVELKKTAALAPMAGVADQAFREICVQWGASYVVGEMCSAKGLTYGSEKSAELLYTSPEEQPAGVQLFGEEADVVGEAVTLALAYDPLIIDFNMGCPAPKIAGQGSGCALMKDLSKAEGILKEGVRRSTVPITVKFRKGWDDGSVNAVEFAKMAESAGVSALTIHGRTKQQFYAPPVDLEIIRKVKEAVSIPVIGNGGITTPEGAKEMYDQTGCDLVMVGQGALGRPWIFRQIEAYLEEGVLLPDPSLEEKLEVLYQQVLKAVTYKGERTALREARRHAGWYMYGLTDASRFRKKAGQLETIEDLEHFIHWVLEESRE